MLKIPNGEVIISKGSQICGVCILKGSNVIVHLSLSSEDFHDKNKLWDLWLRYGGCLEVISKHFNEFCWRQGIKAHVTTELSLSFGGKAGAKVAYLFGKHLFIGMKF